MAKRGAATRRNATSEYAVISNRLSAEVKQALYNRFPPEEIAEMLDDTYRRARKGNSPKAMLATIRTIMEYTVGRPTQVNENTYVDLNELLRQVQVEDPVAAALAEGLSRRLMDEVSAAGPAAVVVDGTVAGQRSLIISQPSSSAIPGTDWEALVPIPPGPAE